MDDEMKMKMKMTIMFGVFLVITTIVSIFYRPNFICSALFPFIIGIIILIYILPANKLAASLRG